GGPARPVVEPRRRDSLTLAIDTLLLRAAGDARIRALAIAARSRSHVPALHTSPGPQVSPGLPRPSTPHPSVAPQCVRSVLGSMQTPLQFTSGSGHDSEHHRLRRNRRSSRDRAPCATRSFEAGAPTPQSIGLEPVAVMMAA